MQFPFGFPGEAIAQVVQAELEARKHLKESVRRSRRKGDEENFRKYVLRVFLAFAQEACKLGLAGQWGVYKVRSQAHKFLDNFWNEAYDEFHGRLVISQPRYQPSWSDLGWEFGSSAEWRQFEDQLLAVAKAQGAASKAGSDEKEPADALAGQPIKTQTKGTQTEPVQKKGGRGRPSSVAVRTRQQAIRRIAETGATGERYCQQLDGAGLSTQYEWQKRAGCPKKYLDAWNHPNLSERAKWRHRIADEKSKATALSRKNSPAS